MASADPLVFDMSQMSEATPSVFTKRDMLSLQDQQNGNYASNQIVIDTSQLANSNKYMAYRDAYLTVPMILAASSVPAAASVDGALPDPSNVATSADLGFGLKNWFGSIVHSMILDYSGTTIIQQTPLSGLWNCFVLNTTMSLGDLETIGASIGFYPDDVNFCFTASGNEAGLTTGITNTFNTVAQGALVGNHAGGQQFSNKGMFERQNRMLTSEGGATGTLGSAVSSILDKTAMDKLYSSQVISRVANVQANAAADRKAGCIVYAIQAQIYLKHLHSFFSQIPLLKGVFFRLTLNINNIVMSLKQGSSANQGFDLASSTISSPLGGVNPILIASCATSTGSAGPVLSITDSTGTACRANTFDQSIKTFNTTAQADLRVTLNVGKTVIDSVQRSQLNAANSVTTSSLNSSCILNVPAYTFNPSFEEAYLSQPVKTIMYSDIFQYTTSMTPAAGQFNYLITNGISNIKSVLILPMLASISGGDPSLSSVSGAASLPPYQSPFDTCGGGTTAPYAALQNFNVVIAGQNMVYNQVQYDYQQFEDQLRGVNSINGGLVDGLTSGLIDFHKFQRMYRYYYINCARMLPIDEAVPKSVSISGTNVSKLPLTFYVFIEYGVQVSVDCLTGARV